MQFFQRFSFTFDISIDNYNNNEIFANPRTVIYRNINFFDNLKSQSNPGFDIWTVDVDFVTSTITLWFIIMTIRELVLQ